MGLYTNTLDIRHHKSDISSTKKASYASPPSANLPVNYEELQEIAKNIILGHVVSGLKDILQTKGSYGEEERRELYEIIKNLPLYKWIPPEWEKELEEWSNENYGEKLLIYYLNRADLKKNGHPVLRELFSIEDILLKRSN